MCTRAARPACAALSAATASASGQSNIATLSLGPVPSFSTGGVPIGLYYVQVRASNPFGVSGPSNEVVFSVGGAATPPGPPSGLTASVTGSTVALAWQAPAGDWTVLRFGCTLNDHCRVSTCSEGWEGYALDPFDGGAFQQEVQAIREQAQGQIPDVMLNSPMRPVTKPRFRSAPRVRSMRRRCQVHSPG